MPSHSENIAHIRELDWSGLRLLWSSIKAGNATGWSPGRAFELLVLRAFELDGAEVRWPYLVYHAGELIEQLDGAVYVDGLGHHWPGGKGQLNPRVAGPPADHLNGVEAVWAFCREFRS